jgi:hypothetical protein
VAFLAVLTLAACGADNAAPVTVPTTATTTTPPTTRPATTTTPPASTATTKATTTASTTSPGLPTTAPASTAPPTTANSNRCHTNELALSLGAPDIAAGNVYVPVVLHNASSRTCDVAGYPGVSLLDASGATIGAAATRESGVAVTTVRLAPGAAASTAIHTVNQGIAPGGCWPASAKVRVYPPNELDALDVAGAITVCGNLFSITPVVAGTAGR